MLRTTLSSTADSASFAKLNRFEAFDVADWDLLTNPAALGGLDALMGIKAEEWTSGGEDAGE